MTTYKYGLILDEDEINWIKGLDSSVDIENSFAEILALNMTEGGGTLLAPDIYRLSFNVSECIKLGEALEMMIEKCRLEGINPREPFLTNLKHAEALYARRHKDGIQTSVSRFPQR